MDSLMGLFTLTGWWGLALLALGMAPFALVSLYAGVVKS